MLDNTVSFDDGIDIGDNDDAEEEEEEEEEEKEEETNKKDETYDDGDDDNLDYEFIVADIKASHTKTLEADFEVERLDFDESVSSETKIATATDADISPLQRKSNQNRKGNTSSNKINTTITTAVKMTSSKTSVAPAPMQSDTLPIDSYRDEIITRITRDRVTIIHGGTFVHIKY